MAGCSSTNSISNLLKEWCLMAKIIIPDDLIETFDDFVAVTISYLDDASDREEWAENERHLVEFLEQRKWVKAVASYEEKKKADERWRNSTADESSGDDGASDCE